MNILERIYRPTQKDLAAGIRQGRWQGSFVQTSASATQVISTTSFTVPPDTARFVTGFACYCVPGAAQFLDGVQLILSIAGTNTSAIQQPPAQRVAAAATLVHSGPIEFFLALPGEVLSLYGQFNAGVAANSIAGFAWGFDLPRANFI